MEMYVSGWKKRIFLTRSRLMRLAVRLAMHPLSNRSRALAMSNFGVNTGTPTASIDVTGERTSDRITSRSWIIKSKTTSISRLRSGNTPSRCTSMKRGEVTIGITAATAGL